MDIAAIQEMRWKDKGIKLEKQQKAVIYYSGHPSNSMYGCGFVVRNRFRERVIDWKPINERMCYLRIRGLFYNFSLICVYAPTEVSEEQEKDQFYQHLDKLVDGLPKYDAKIILGDFNAKVGFKNELRGTVGKHSLHEESNDNGGRLTGFALSRGMFVSSTNFSHLQVHKATWVSPDHRTSNQIDHILTDARHASCVLDVRSYRGANIDSDHYLVKAKIRSRVSMARTSPPQVKRINIEALQRPEVATAYADSISLKLRELQSPMHANEHWQACVKIVNEASTTHLSNDENYRPRNKWFDDECQQLVSAKNQARRHMLQQKTRDSKEKSLEDYRRKRREAYKLIRVKKRQQQKQEISNLENLRSNNEIRKFYKSLNRQRKGFQPTSNSSIINDRSGNLLTEKAAVLNRWVEYFDELLNGDRSSCPLSLPTIHGPNPEETSPPTLSEVKTALSRLKNHKSPGSDGISAEMLKSGGDVLSEHIYEIIGNIWRKEILPEDWNVSIVFPIYKKGSAKDCTNYRGISILNTAYKILSRILCEKLKPYVSNAIGPYQCGFMPGKGTTDQIFTLRQILEKTQEYNITTHHLFIDFRQAYDSIDRSELLLAMNLLGVPPKLINLCKMTISETSARVKVDNETSDIFYTNRGVKQGDGLSCDLFNLCLEYVIRKAEIETSGTIFNKTLQPLGYADDIDLISRSFPDLVETLKKLVAAAESVGLKLNEGKTKYMISSRSVQQVGQNVNFDGTCFECVREFIYLGTQVNNTNDLGEEVSRRITLANRCLFGLGRILRSKLLSRSTKFTIYKTLIIPVLMYGSEAWTLGEREQNQLGVFERKVLRVICGPVYVHDEWRIRLNDDLYHIYQEATIVQRIKQQRLRWLGHVSRMESNNVVKRVFEAVPQGVRSRGRPRSRWKDAVLADVRKLTTNPGNWRSLAANRGNWRKIVSQSQNLHGL